MPDNVILTRTVAGIIGESMPETTEPNQKYPAMRFHPTLPPVTVQNEEEEKALPEGYRDKVWSEEEIAAQATLPARHPPAASEEPPAPPSEDPPHTPRSRR
jgi:hypothetical protein